MSVDSEREVESLGGIIRRRVELPDGMSDDLAGDMVEEIAAWEEVSGSSPLELAIELFKIVQKHQRV